MAEKTLLSKKLVLFGVLRQQKGMHALVTMLETTQSASFLGTKKLFIPKKYLAHFALNEPVTPAAQTNSPILINLERGTAQAYVPLPPQGN